ncbi:hypothetical protein MHBO_003763 [Bonamia ostreae]|uniref:Uncharacterized protein n=1 Tax=Bonamia ostreae TaxID=126728 RepID=A0ABV2ARI8_9EUKA
MRKFIDDQATKSLRYMSSDEGKKNILNPRGRKPIIKESSSSLDDAVGYRVRRYIDSIVNCPEVIGEFNEIQDEILQYYEKLSSELKTMENELKGSDEKEIEEAVSYRGESHAPFFAGLIATSPIWIPLLATAVVIAIVSLPFIAPVIAFLGRDARKKKIIDEEYAKYKTTCCTLVCDALNRVYGSVLHKLIETLTHNIFDKRIEFLKETIKDLSDNREQIIEQQECLGRLTEKLEHVERMLEKIIQDSYAFMNNY